MKTKYNSKLPVSTFLAGMLMASPAMASIVYLDLEPNYILSDGTAFDLSNFDPTLGSEIDLGDDSIGEQPLPPHLGVGLNHLDSSELTSTNIAISYGIGLQAGTMSLANDHTFTFSTPGSPTDESVTGYFAFDFTNADVNNGDVTVGLLEITSSYQGGEFRVELGDVFFDDALANADATDILNGVATATEFTAVPEPTSSVLIAMGAVGFLIRRRR